MSSIQRLPPAADITAEIDWNNAEATFVDAAHAFVQAGIPRKDLIPLIPRNAVLGPGSKIDPSQRGKIPGRYRRDGAWVGLSGGWASEGLSAELQKDAAQWPTENIGLRAADFPAVVPPPDSETPVCS